MAPAPSTDVGRCYGHVDRNSGFAVLSIESTNLRSLSKGSLCAFVASRSWKSTWYCDGLLREVLGKFDVPCRYVLKFIARFYVLKIILYFSPSRRGFIFSSFFFFFFFCFDIAFRFYNCSAVHGEVVAEVMPRD